MKKPADGFSLPFDFSMPQPTPAVEREVVYERFDEAPPPLRREPPEEPRALSVAELGQKIRRSVEGAFTQSVWVAGEVSGARPAASGHLYFSLKDEEEDATIDVAFYKTSLTQRARKLIVDGARIRVRGRPSYWAPRGKLQFSADGAEPLGKGALLLALEMLKEKLTAEGLFAKERKRPLPPDPRIVGVVTSSGGAVIHDIRKVAFRRGGARILLAPAAVQGVNAAHSVRVALRKLQRVEGVDVIIIARGGGSSDDLQCFNDEALVREIAACRVPVVSAVGHEVDITLTDFAADVRAATPSQAAEMVVPNRAARGDLLHERTRALVRAMQARLSEEEIVLHRLSQKMADPRILLLHAQQLLDEQRSSVVRETERHLRQASESVSGLRRRLTQRHPTTVIARERAEMVRLTHAIGQRMRARIAEEVAGSGSLAARLDAMSPLKVLSRGYAIVTRRDGSAVRDAKAVSLGERVAIRVDRGSIEAEIVSTHDPEETG